MFWTVLNYTCGQSDIRLGFGADVGLKNKTGQGGFMLNVEYKNRVGIYSGVINYALFRGIGFSLGSEVFLTKTPWQPVVGVTYCYFDGNRFYTGEKLGNSTDYFIPSSNGIIFHTGIRYLLYPRTDESSKGALSFQPYICYRSWFTPLKVKYLAGDVNIDKENDINHRIGNGVGFGLSVVYFFGYNE